MGVRDGVEVEGLQEAGQHSPEMVVRKDSR